MCAGWHSVCRAAGQSASLLLSPILLYSVADPVPVPSCVSALVDHRPQCKYVESLVRILCSFLCSALWLCPGKGTRRTLAAAATAMGAPPETQRTAQPTSRSSENAAEIIISACHICFSTVLLRYFFCAISCKRVPRAWHVVVIIVIMCRWQCTPVLVGVNVVMDLSRWCWAEIWHKWCDIWQNKTI